MRLMVCLIALAGIADSASASIRIVNWNLFNRPNTPADESALVEVFGAISTSASGSVVDAIDILAVQETDTGSTDSYARTLAALNSTGAGTYLATPASTASGAGDRTGILYDSGELSLVESNSIPGLVNPATRARFRPAGTSGSFDFWVYSVHLTASSATARGTEMSLLRADADALGSDAPVLWIGDFNLLSSNEAAWAALEAPGPARARDVADAPGIFSGNASFIHLHTQDPRSSMNDRFDFQFATDELFDGAGIDHIPGTYSVFGNNGTHALGGAITGGTGASTSVLASLAALSDHLPVQADYRIIIPEPGITSVLALIAASLRRPRRGMSPF
jgi:endonuclease/exonuclease/phosphatase family metal-dependent hydrolase